MRLNISKLAKRARVGLFLLPLLSLFIGSSMLKAEEMASNQARIILSEGDVKVGSNVATKGMMIDQGGQVSTGEDSSALVSLGEGRKSAVKLDGGTTIALTSLEPVKINLQAGKIIALVNGLSEGSTFQVMTPTATATARGTQFSMTDHMVSVLKGTVDVDINGQTTEITAGHEFDLGSKEISDISADSSNDIENASEEASSAQGDASTSNDSGESRQNIQVPVTP